MREEELQQLRDGIRNISTTWFPNRRPNNAGGVGNTLEDLLGVTENNLPAPDFGEWELKSQRENTSSLVTLFHMEPNPRNARFVPRVLLPQFGWAHQQAGTTYDANERSFRQTIFTNNYSSRGFKVVVDRPQERLYVDFNFEMITDSNEEWRNGVFEQTGGCLSVNPFWSFDDISTKLNGKLQNVVFVTAETRVSQNVEQFRYSRIEVYMRPSLENFLACIDQGVIAVDFDARTGHNHGTKFRIQRTSLSHLYEQVVIV